MARGMYEVKSCMQGRGFSFGQLGMKSIVLGLMVGLRISSFAASIEVDGVEYAYEIVGDVVKLVKAKVSPDRTGKVMIPSKLLGREVTIIAKNAFVGCGEVEGFVIPETVTNINVCAFMRDYEHSPAGFKGLPCLSDVFFLGIAPEVSWEDVKAPEYWGGQFSYHTVYVDERLYRDFSAKVIDGEAGYSYSEYGAGYEMCGGIVKKGFAQVSFTPENEVVEEHQEVALGSSNEEAVIYYTLDGSSPEPQTTDRCMRYEGPIAIDTRQRIRAIAVVPDYSHYIVGEKEYAFGALEAPEITSDQASLFYQSKNKIVMNCPTSSAIIRYTTNDMAVTSLSPVFSGPLYVSETTTVRAKAFKENWFDSEEVVRTFTRLWHTNETPVIEAAAESFAKASQTVVLSCVTEGATVYYTIDGSEPTVANGRAYKGPFKIYQTTVVKAIAVKDDWKDSAVASAMFTKENALGPALNLLEVMPDNDKEHPWSVVTDVTHDGVSAVRSGAVGEDESTTLKVVVYGAGRLSFWWKSACEPSVDGEYYDYVAFSNGSVEVAKLAGVTDWQQVVLDVVGTGKHTFKWTYRKDDSGYEPPDCVWIDQVLWLPQTSDYYAGHTLTTETPVPYVWLDAYGLGRSDDFETAAKAKTGKVDGAGHELTVEEEYVAGTDPTNTASRLEAYIEMNDGMPVVRWVPDLNENGTKGLRTYKVWGKETIDSSKWEYPTNALHRFFKVTVEMP